MNKRIFYRATFTVVPLLLSLLCLAQSKTTVKISADRSSILIGEPIRLSLEADIPENEPIRFFSLDTLPHFEFLSKEKIDTSNTGSGTVLKQIVYITSFDSGHWVVPPLPLGTDIATDSIPIDIGFAAFDPQQPYHDIKDIIEVNPEKKKERPWWFWYAIAGGGLIILLIIYLLLRKKKKPVVVVTQAPVDPYREALEQLEELARQRPDDKQYYSKLVDIFRVYVAKRKGIHSLQQTTDDLVSQLQTLNLPAAQFEKLAQSLRTSDFVKFAKYEPGSGDDLQIMEVITGSIKTIEQMK